MGVRVDVLKRSRRVILALALLALTIAVLSLLYPMLKKKDTIQVVGDKAITEMRPFSIALSRLAADKINGVVSSSEDSSSYSSLSSLLAEIRRELGFERVYLVNKGTGGKYYIVADSGIGSSSYTETSMTEYLRDPYGTAFPTLDKVYGQKNPYLYTTNIVTLKNLKDVVVSYIPITDVNSNVLCVLAIDSPTGNLKFNVIGNVNLTTVAMISFAAFILLMCIRLILGEIAKKRKQAIKLNEEKAAEKAAAQRTLKTDAPADNKPDVSDVKGAETSKDIVPADVSSVSKPADEKSSK